MNGQRIEEEEEGQFTNGPQIFSLEMEADEEEFDSLMKETLGNATVNRVKNGRNRLNAVLSRNFNFRHRANAVIATAVAHGEGRKKNIIQGFLRSHVGNASSMRNIAMLSVLAICSFILVRALNQNMAHGPVDQIQARPHAPSLGGSLNSGHYQQQPHDDLHAVSAKNTNSIAEDDYSGYDDDYEGSAQLPQSNVGVGVLSVTSHNIENGPGHYLHDPLKSPYASPYYAVYKNNSAQLDAMQKDFERKMAAVNATYGRWETPTWSVGLTTVDFSYAHRKDVKGADFPDGAWQSNAAYVQNFLKQAKLLVARVREGIFTEYGYGTMNVTSTAKKNDIIVKRLSEFQVIVSDTLVLKDGTAVRDKKTGLKAPGIAYLNTAASEGLIRKLLHAMVTTDEFYVVSTGNVNTYASNNFAQSAVMEFNYIMEPVFDRLGVKLISRNMGMNASMAISALGGTDIYGEADIFWHIPTSPSGTPESAAVTDLLHKQAILSGERMPVILTADPVGILVATNNKAWFGNLQPGASFCEASVLQDGKTLVPAVKACRYVNCSPGSDCDKHDSVCWIERSDQNLLPGQSQDNDVGHQKEGYPSVQTQRLEGRKLAMLVLHALEEALDLWTEQSRKGSFPLPDDLWHVGPVYDELREMVRTLRSSECDYLFRKLDSNICHMEMHVSSKSLIHLRRHSTIHELAF